MSEHRPPREIAVERAVGLCFEDVPFAVLMATPQDIIDLAYGFALTEGIAQPRDIAEIQIEDTEDGLRVNITRHPTAQHRLPRARSIESRSGCGVCGTSRLRDVIRELPQLPAGAIITGGAILNGLQELETGQILGNRTRATHAAAFADAHGHILALREDVGRHNALDKLAGALAQHHIAAAEGFVIITSRCSFEMVEKTARIGAPILVAVSAPTSLAIERAEACGLTLVALARADGFETFTNPTRVKLGVSPR